MKEKMDGENGWVVRLHYRRLATQFEQSFLDFQRFNRRR